MPSLMLTSLTNDKLLILWSEWEEGGNAAVVFPPVPDGCCSSYWFLIQSRDKSLGKTGVLFASLTCPIPAQTTDCAISLFLVAPQAWAKSNFVSPGLVNLLLVYCTCAVRPGLFCQFQTHWCGRQASNRAAGFEVESFICLSKRVCIM